MPSPRSMKRLPEKVVQQAVKHIFALAGCTAIADFSQPRATMQTPGVPDLYVWFLDCEIAFWFEVKARNGTQTVMQRAWQLREEKVGHRYFMGGVKEAIAAVVELGIQQEGWIK